MKNVWTLCDSWSAPGEPVLPQIERHPRARSRVPQGPTAAEQDWLLKSKNWYLSSRNWKLRWIHKLELETGTGAGNWKLELETGTGI
eukprot:4604841-Pyramimonas_sp.AAC.1